MNILKYLILIALIVVIGACDSMNKHMDNEALVARYVEAVETQDFEMMEAILSDDYIGYGPSAGDSISKIGALEKWEMFSNELYENIEYTRAEYAGIRIREGENKGYWVATWAELNIKYHGERGAASIWANTNYKVENGKIVKSYTFYNEADVLRQLGWVFINPNNL